MASTNPLPIQAALSETDRINWLRLCRSENVGPITFYQVLNHFGSVSTAIEQIPEMANRGGRKNPIQILSIMEAEREYFAHKKSGAHLLTCLDPTYPHALLSLTDAPPVLSAFGRTELLNNRALAVVGSRNASLNGKRFAEQISKDLGEQGWVITSGLARGIDSHAHKGSLPTGTIAVLAGGADHIYPPENQALYDAIKEKGVILSEAPLGDAPKSHFFPRRNRVISGLSTGVLVVEAAIKSGSLITARYALEQGREVFAVPGSPYDPRCRGTNSLISQGATLVQSIEDIIEGVIQHLPKGVFQEETALYEPQSKKIFSEQVTDTKRKQVEENLSHAPVGLDELARQCQICTEELLCIILELELAGRISRSPGNEIALITP